MVEVWWKCGGSVVEVWWKCGGSVGEVWGKYEKDDAIIITIMGHYQSIQLRSVCNLSIESSSSACTSYFLEIYFDNLLPCHIY